jgi:hypothetical protein
MTLIGRSSPGPDKDQMETLAFPKSSPHGPFSPEEFCTGRRTRYDYHVPAKLGRQVDGSPARLCIAS